MPSIQEVSQSLDLEAPIDLFTLSAVGMPDFAFTNIANVVFSGVPYQAIPCEFEWIAKTSEGAVPTSRLVISDVTGVIGAIVEGYSAGLVGATLTAIQTYRLFLDNSPGADATQHYPPVRLRLNKRTWEPGSSLEFECITGFDIERRKLPGRAYLRRCGWYLSDSDCRASRNIHFDLAGNPTTEANRACAKDSRSCQQYHGAEWGKFYGGFLGSSRR